MGSRHRLARNRRFRVGCVPVLVGIPNLAANTLWLQAGDIHRPNHHVVMRGGWPGFWIVSILAVSVLVAGIWLLILEWRAKRERDDKRLKQPVAHPL